MIINKQEYIMRKFFLILSLLILSTCSSNKEEWLIIPGISIGPITESNSEADLISHFGRENIKRKKIYIGEGQFLNGHVIFENTRNECSILWINELEPPIDRIILEQPNSNWHMKNGIRVGMNLARLNEINTRSFKFYGFSWDMGGLIVSFEGGSIAEDANDALVIYLSPETGKEIPNEFLGEIEISSDNPLLMDLDLRISKIEILLQNSQPKKGIIIAKSGLSLRDSPNIDGVKQASIPFEYEVEIVDMNGPISTIDNITGHWLKVKYNQYEGWVFGGYVDVTE
jgi:hypothetical protein